MHHCRIASSIYLRRAVVYFAFTFYLTPRAFGPISDVSLDHQVASATLDHVRAVLVILCHLSAAWSGSWEARLISHGYQFFQPIAWPGMDLALFEYSLIYGQDAIRGVSSPKLIKDCSPASCQDRTYSKALRSTAYRGLYIGATSALLSS